METANSSYSATVNFLQCIYSMLVAKNHHNFQSKCLVYAFSFTDISNDINHGIKAAILKKKSFVSASVVVVATYCCYKKLCRSFCTSVLSYLITIAKIQNMMDIKVIFHQWFIKSLIKDLLVLILQVVLLKVKLCETKN